MAKASARLRIGAAHKSVRVVQLRSEPAPAVCQAGPKSQQLDSRTAARAAPHQHIGQHQHIHAGTPLSAAVTVWRRPVPSAWVTGESDTPASCRARRRRARTSRPRVRAARRAQRGAPLPVANKHRRVAAHDRAIGNGATHHGAEGYYGAGQQAWRLKHRGAGLPSAERPEERSADSRAAMAYASTVGEAAQSSDPQNSSHPAGQRGSAAQH